MWKTSATRDESRRRLAGRVREYARAQFDVGLYAHHCYELSFTERLPHSEGDERFISISLDNHYAGLTGPLVILGEPGAGKTTVLHQLACRDRQPSDSHNPIPVVFELGTWTKRRPPLTAWLTGELKRKYGVGLSLAHEWVEGGVIVPMLDGLDAVPLQHRPVCVSEINAYCRAHRASQVVVTCREHEYAELTESASVAATWRIEAASTVLLGSLTRAQLEDYVNREPGRCRGLRVALESEPELWRIVTTPLMLWVAAIALEDENDGTVGRIRSPDTLGIRDELLDRYLEKIVKHQSAAETTEWLRKTAAAMTRSGSSYFCLEDLSSSWLPQGGGRRFNVFTVRLLLGLISAVSVGSVAGAIVGWMDALKYGAGDGVAVGMIGGGIFAAAAGLVGLAVNNDAILPVDDAVWSWSGAGWGLRYGLTGGLLLAVLIAWNISLTLGVVTAVFMAFSFGLAFAFTGMSVKARTGVNVGLKQSAMSAVRYFVLLMGAAAASLFVARARAEEDLLSPIFAWGAGLVVIAPLFALMKGGAFCIKNLTLRALLAVSREIPWRYRAFLQNAVDGGVMIRQGGSFGFIHPLFQDLLSRPAIPLEDAPPLLKEAGQSAGDSAARLSHDEVSTTRRSRYDRAGLVELLRQNSIEPPREKLARIAEELSRTSDRVDAIVGLGFMGVIIAAKVFDSLAGSIFLLTVALIGAFALITYGTEAKMRGLRARVRDAFAEFDRLPNCRPILFLRPFSRERWERFFDSLMRTGDPLERIVVDEMHDLGPVVAVGRPREQLPPFGAARFYIKGEQWQPVILKLLVEIEFVVVVCGATAGLLWEFARIVELVDPSRLILCIPKQRTFRRRRESWREFRKATREIFPQPFPEELRRSTLFFCFDAEWRPVAVEARAGAIYGRKAVREALQVCRGRQ